MPEENFNGGADDNIPRFHPRDGAINATFSFPLPSASLVCAVVPFLKLSTSAYLLARSDPFAISLTFVYICVRERERDLPHLTISSLFDPLLSEDEARRVGSLANPFAVPVANFFFSNFPKIIRHVFPRRPSTGR